MTEYQPAAVAPPPPNSRIFLGNLASERTTIAELLQIFSRYGRIIEEPVVRKSYGFIQYDNPDSARAAIEGEAGRILGGMRLDLNLASNRAKERGGDDHKDKGSRGDRDRDRGYDRDGKDRNYRDGRDRRDDRREERRDRRDRPYDDDRSSRRRRSRSRSPHSRDDRGSKRFHGGGQPRPRVLCRILCIGEANKDYADEVEQALLRQVGTFAVESDVIRLPSVDDQIADSERRGMRYTIVVGRRSAASRVLTLYVFRPNTAREELRDMQFATAIEYIQREEQFIAQLQLQQQQQQQTQMQPAQMQPAQQMQPYGMMSAQLQQVPPQQYIPQQGGYPPQPQLTTPQGSYLPQQPVTSYPPQAQPIPAGQPQQPYGGYAPAPVVAQAAPTAPVAATPGAPAINYNALSSLLATLQQRPSQAPPTTSTPYAQPPSQIPQSVAPPTTQPQQYVPAQQPYTPQTVQPQHQAHQFSGQTYASQSQSQPQPQQPVPAQSTVPVHQQHLHNLLSRLSPAQQQQQMQQLQQMIPQAQPHTTSHMPTPTPFQSYAGVPTASSSYHPPGQPQYAQQQYGSTMPGQQQQKTGYSPAYPGMK